VVINRHTSELRHELITPLVIVQNQEQSNFTAKIVEIQNLLRMVDYKVQRQAYHPKQKPLTAFFVRCYVCGEEFQSVKGCFKVHNQYICGDCIKEYNKTRRRYKYLPPTKQESQTIK
jgi:formylmethanofuran dehydrogenase subunit E